MIKFDMKLLISYFRNRLYYIVIILVFIGTFIIPFLLYHLPISLFLYALTLASGVTFLLFVRDYLVFAAKHRKLIQMLDQEVFQMADVPRSDNQIEEDYTELLCRLYRNQTKLLSEADRRNTEVMEYYTMWAHQIKVPIAAMRLLLQADTGFSKKEELRKELFKTEQYVEMALQFVRMDCMTQDLILKEYVLYDMVKQAVRKYSLLFIYNKLNLNLEEFDCTVITDEKWFVFVLEQILSNAIKYTPSGSVSIYLDPHEPKTLVIEDSGIGIEKEDISRVFDKGFTGYNGRMNKKSTGIGLYLSKQILTKIGHRIKISSEVGKGTAVRIGLGRETLLKE